MSKVNEEDKQQVEHSCAVTLWGPAAQTSTLWLPSSLIATWHSALLLCAARYLYDHLFILTPSPFLSRAESRPELKLIRSLFSDIRHIFDPNLVVQYCRLVGKAARPTRIPLFAFAAKPLSRSLSTPCVDSHPRRRPASHHVTLCYLHRGAHSSQAKISSLCYANWLAKSNHMRPSQL